MKKQYVWITLFVLLTTVVATIFVNTSGQAQFTAQGELMGQAPEVILVAGQDLVEPMYVPPSEEFGQLHAQTSSFQINWRTDADCQTWPTDAKTAFQYAVTIWESLVDSPVTIVVDACWADLTARYGSPYILGSAGAADYAYNFPNRPYSNTWYPIALANSLAGYDLSPSYPDIDANFNSAFVSWYLGTGSSTPPGQYNFVSVVLHELCHGLGFLPSMSKYGTNQAYWGGGTTYPLIFDRFIENGGGENLIAKYPNATYYNSPSAALFSELTGGNIWFDGTNANQANGGGRVKLYAPGTWSSGSSISHLDYNTYVGGPNTLMVYALNPGVTVHDPGPVTKGILKDIGWQSDAPTPTPTFTPTPTATPTPIATRVPLSGITITATHKTTTTIQIPGSVLPEAITLTVSFTDVNSYATNQEPVEPGLALRAVRTSNGAPLAELNGPFTMTIAYDDLDVAGIKEETLMVYYWNSSQWVTATETCSPPTTFTRNTAGNRFTIQVCDMTKYALIGETERVFLPIIMKSYSP